MYFLVQKYKSDLDGYPVPANHSHITLSLKETFCGLKIDNEMTFSYGCLSLKNWFIQKTTCKNCLKIAANRLLNQ
jgi:hypothetical protein